MRSSLSMLIATTTSIVLLRGSRAFTNSRSSSFVGRSIRSSASFFSSSPSNSNKNIFNLRGGSTTTPSSTMLSASNRPFVTWTFDTHCASMEWNTPPSVPLSATSTAATSSSSVAVVQDADLIIVGVFAPPTKDDDNNNDEKDEDDKEEEVEPIVFTGIAKQLDEELGGALSELANDNSKAFQNGSTAGSMTPALRIASTGGGKTKRCILLGLGAEGKVSKDGTPPKMEPSSIMKVGGAVASAIHDQKKITTCNVLLPTNITQGITTQIMLTDFSTAYYSGLYVDNRYRTGKKIELKAETVQGVTLYLEENNTSDDITTTIGQEAIATGLAIASGCALTKDIVNAPHNVLNSESLAETAQRIAAESGGSITCTILGKEECEARGMGAYLGVARGSETEPQFIHLTYKPDGEIKKKVGCVGKGLLFDTGGYNIKTSSMELMKFDCGGAAAVLGAARAIGTIKPMGVEAHFIVAACENMISAKAYVPSDILTASNNKTIEILNTDAEGRLTLADALVYADKECGCEKIIELSTLTGACMISLGKKICGVWTDDDDLAKELEDVSKATGDKSWRMPLAKEYMDLLKSKVADISNLGGPYGGAITAALFLTEFVNKKKPFAHIDIAGPVWDAETCATGFGAKLVTEWIRRQGE